MKMNKNSFPLELRGQFHQPYGTKRKCASSYSSAPIGAIQFHQQKYAQLYWYLRLENTLFYSYALHSTLCASRIGISLLA